MVGTDRAWRRFGRDDPFFGVLTDDDHRSAALDEAGVEALYETGVEYVGWLRSVVHDVAPDLRPRRALDFGCGVGRLTLPLAEWVGTACGVDISDSMLEVARARVDDQQVAGVTFLHSSEIATLPRFDLVHSFIVLQHVRPRRGLRIVADLLDHVDDGGMAILHVTYRSSFGRTARLRQLAYMNVPGLWPLKNLVTRRGREPMVQMHLYDLNRILGLLQSDGFHAVSVRFSRHGEFDGVVLFAERRALPFR